VPRFADLDKRELELVAKEAELHRLEATLRRTEQELATAVPAAPQPVDELATRRLHEHERALVEREGRLSKLEELADASRSRLEEKERRGDELEQQLKLRLQELDEKELALDKREASFIAEYEIREQRVEDREREGEEREIRLSQRETHLQTYVGQLQNQFANEGEWWAKQLGSDAPVQAA
jgi:DNA repair exonuclease SbcCD ATPase subunit